MATPAIRVENLGKKYRLAHAANGIGRYKTLRDSLAGGVATVANRVQGRSARATVEEFWALKDVSFEVQPGEVVGIIGRNGAGKSTLLKILSRITKPTTGRAVINGRVGSLLEVGTGFHPELTGRENVYLNGSILGMSRREIERKFDEIVAFAEVERFLDTPVKRYSSGMYVRLAFAVAAHLEPEILIVDEVLAVGDSQFQKKCLGKMGDVAKQGRTVLLVTHQLDAIRRLCPRGILLERGRLIGNGDRNKVLDQYVQSGPNDSPPGGWISLTDAARIGQGGARFVAAKYWGTEPEGTVHSDGLFRVTVRIDSDVNRIVSSLAVTVYDRYDIKLVNADSLSLGQPVELRRGLNEVSVRIRSLHIMPGTYNIGLWLANPPVVFDHLNAAFTVESHMAGLGHFGRRPAQDGLVTCDFSLDS
jgi:lipopolysaccharide transport system ATP-binding protein